MNFGSPQLLPGEESENVAANLLGQVFLIACGYGSPMVPKQLIPGVNSPGTTGYG